MKVVDNRKKSIKVPLPTYPSVRLILMRTESSVLRHQPMMAKTVSAIKMGAGMQTISPRAIL